MMKQTLFFLLVMATFLTMGCKKDGNPYESLSQKELAILIGERLEEIFALASPVACTDPDEWRITDIETECGLRYIPYLQSVDEKELRSLIRDYNLLMEMYKPLAASSIRCAYYGVPIGIACEHGKAIPQYEPLGVGGQ